MTIYDGEWRIPGKDGQPDKVQVTDKKRDDALIVTEDEYNKGPFRTPLEDLPWLGDPAK